MKDDKIKRMDIKEFREKGYLQELNRRFLHPLGLALEVEVEDNGNEKLGGVWDYRKDEEGIYYDINNSNEERLKRFYENKKFIDNEIIERGIKRREKLGFNSEEINYY